MIEEKNEKIGFELTKRYKLVHEADGSSRMLSADQPIIMADHKLPIKVVFIERTTKITDIMRVEAPDK